jgi:hypothetical protein
MYAGEHPKAAVHQVRSKWLRHVIRALWQLSETMWLHRNKTLNQNASTLIAESAIDAQIRHLYLHQDDFAAGDRVLFNISLQDRLKTSLNSRKHWLALIRRYQETTEAQSRGNQDLITKFFTRAVQSLPPEGIT